MGDIKNGVSFEFVGMVTGPLIAMWIIALGVLSLGVQKGIAKVSSVLMPVLVIMFMALVIYSLFLPGAEKRLRCFILHQIGQNYRIQVYGLPHMDKYSFLSQFVLGLW